jgi:hypothetical protein
VIIETKDDFARVLERLRRRDPEALAAFILSLVQDAGPVGEQVRTFIVGDNVAEVAKSVSEGIKGLEILDEYAHRHARGREMGEHLAFIVESIERLVLPVGPWSLSEYSTCAALAGRGSGCKARGAVRSWHYGQAVQRRRRPSPGPTRRDRADFA